MIAAAQAQNVFLISGACRSRCADWRLLRTNRDPPATSRRDMCAHRDVRTFNGSTNSWVGLFCLAADLSLLCRARRLDLRRGPSPWNRRPAGRRLAAAAAAAEAFISINHRHCIMWAWFELTHIQMTALIQDIFNLPCGPAATMPWTLGHDSRHTDNEQTRKPAKQQANRAANQQTNKLVMIANQQGHHQSTTTNNKQQTEDRTNQQCFLLLVLLLFVFLVHIHATHHSQLPSD